MKIAITSFLIAALPGCATTPYDSHGFCKTRKSELREGVDEGSVERVTLLDEKVVFISWRDGGLGCAAGFSKEELLDLVRGKGIGVTTEYSDAAL